MFHIIFFFRAKTTTSSKAQPLTALRLLPIPNTDDNSQNPLQQPISIHSQIFDDSNTQQTTTFHSISMQKVSTINVLQKNGNSSIRCIQKSHEQHMQT